MLHHDTTTSQILKFNIYYYMHIASPTQEPPGQDGSPHWDDRSCRRRTANPWGIEANPPRGGASEELALVAVAAPHTGTPLAILFEVIVITIRAGRVAFCNLYGRTHDAEIESQSGYHGKGEAKITKLLHDKPPRSVAPRRDTRTEAPAEVQGTPVYIGIPKKLNSKF